MTCTVWRPIFHTVFWPGKRRCTTSVRLYYSYIKTGNCVGPFLVTVKDGASNGARFCCGHHRRYRDGKLRGTVKFSARQYPSIFPLAEIDGNSYFPYFTPFFAVDDDDEVYSGYINKILIITLGIIITCNCSLISVLSWYCALLLSCPWSGKVEI